MIFPLLALPASLFVFAQAVYAQGTARAWSQHDRKAFQIALTSAERPFQTSSLESLYPAYNLSVPVSHFPDSPLYRPHSNGTFPLRYWFDSTFYKPGGPVILLAAGETSGASRLPFLQKGLLHQLASATGGIGVILEHRYYGTSFPVQDLSTENLRFLTTEQALADTVFFAKNVVFPGLEAARTRPEEAAWIAYGGSYAGAFAAFLRTQAPDVFWGAISSSGVTEAILDYWEYFEAARLYGPSDCIGFTQDAVELVDGILLAEGEGKAEARLRLKKAFGLQGISHDADFAAALTMYGIGGWQGRNWDPKVSSPAFDRFCGNVSHGQSALYPATEALRPSLAALTAESTVANRTGDFVNQLLNFIGWTNVSVVQPCARAGLTQEQCYGSYNASEFAEHALATYPWRSWTYQVCTQWGYFQTSNTPAEIRPIQSRLVDMPYSTKICEFAFDISAPPDIDAVNKYGGFGIELDRLAIVDGEADPWRWATPHRPGLGSRPDTLVKPFLQIEGAVHHWDENGLFKNETTADLPPGPVRDAQEELVRAVVSWVEEFEARKAEGNGMGMEL